MVISILADGSAAEAAGEMFAAIAIPTAGLIMLVIGLTRKNRTTAAEQHGPWAHPGVSGQWPPPPPGSASGAPPYGPPAPPPGNQHLADRLYPPPSPGHPFPAPGPFGSSPHQPPLPVSPGYPIGAPRARQSSTALTVIGALLLAAGLANFAGAQIRAHRASLDSARTSSTTAARTGANYPLEVGQCITAAAYTAPAVMGPVPCDGEMASYELAFKGDQKASCPDGERNDSVYAALISDYTTLCFSYNFIEGQCYVGDGTTPPAYTIAACSSPKAMKVVRRIDDSTSAAACPERSKSVVFPQPARVFCLGAP